MVEIATEKEIQRRQRNERMVARWDAIYDKERGSRNRFLEVLAKEYKLSLVQVKNILKANGRYN